MTTPPARWYADLPLALLLVVLEAGALVVAWFYVALGAWAAQDGSGDYSAAGLWITTGVTGLVAAVVAVTGRRRLPITAVSQGLVAVALVLLALGGAGFEYREAHPEPVPTSDYDGPGGQCRSGGDSDECLGG